MQFGRRHNYMKRLMICLIVTIMVLSGCGNNVDTPIDDLEEGQVNETEPDSQVMEEFNTFIDESDFPKEVVAYVDERIEELNTETANRMVLGLTKHLHNFFYYDSNLWNTMEELNGYYTDQGFNPEDINEPHLRDFYNDLIDSGYKLVSIEGMLNPIVDYRWMAKYNDVVSDDISDYFELCAIESDVLSAKDAGLNISWDELGSRAIAAETFLLKYPNTLALGDASYLYERYLWMYMLGLNNTPIVDWDTNKVTDEVLNSYHKLIENHKESATADALSNYLEILSDIDFVIPYSNEEEYLKFDKRVEDLINNTVSLYTQETEE